MATVWTAQFRRTAQRYENREPQGDDRTPDGQIGAIKAVRNLRGSSLSRKGAGVVTAVSRRCNKFVKSLEITLRVMFEEGRVPQEVYLTGQTMDEWLRLNTCVNWSTTASFR